MRTTPPRSFTLSLLTLSLLAFGTSGCDLFGVGYDYPTELDDTDASDPDADSDGDDPDADDDDSVVIEPIPTGDEMIEIDGSSITFYASANPPEGYNDEQPFYLFPGTDEEAENPACLRGEPWPLRWEESGYCVDPDAVSWTFDLAELALPVGTYRFTPVSENPVFAWAMYGPWDWAWDDAGGEGHPAVYDNDGDGSGEGRSVRVVWNGETPTPAGN